jgi:hypothetical protein
VRVVGAGWVSLLLFGLEDVFKDFVGEDILAVVQVVVGGEFCVNMVSFQCVEVCTFSLVMEDLHCVVYVAQGVRLL